MIKLEVGKFYKIDLKILLGSFANNFSGKVLIVDMHVREIFFTLSNLDAKLLRFVKPDYTL